MLIWFTQLYMKILSSSSSLSLIRSSFSNKLSGGKLLEKKDLSVLVWEKMCTRMCIKFLIFIILLSFIESALSVNP